MDTDEIKTEQTSTAITDLDVLVQSSEKGTILLDHNESELKNKTDYTTDIRKSEKPNNVVVDSEYSTDSDIVIINLDEDEVSEIRNEPPKQKPQQQNEIHEEPMKTFEYFSTKKLSRASKKKFRILLSHGVPFEEARVMCYDTMDSIKIALGLNSERAVKPTSTIYDAAIEPRKSIIRAAILPVDFPVTILSRQQLENIQEIVLDKIASCKGSKVKPKFFGTECRFGWLCLTCADTPTFEWLKVITSELNPYKGTTLKCVNKHQVPESVSYDAILQGSEGYGDSKILSLIENQNEKLSTSKWRIVSRVKTDLKNKILVTFYIDFESEKVLRGMRYKINYKFGQTEFVKAGNMQNAPNETQRAQLSKQKTNFTKPVPSNLKKFKPFFTTAKHNLNKAIQQQRNERFNSRSAKSKKQINNSFDARRDYSPLEHFILSERDTSSRDRGRDSSSRDRYSNSRGRDSSSRDRDTRTCKCCSSRSIDNNNCFRYEGIRSLREQNSSSSGLKRKNDEVFESYYTKNRY